MSAHILLPALDPARPAPSAPPPSPACCAPARRRLGYDGLIVTDGMEMQAISAHLRHRARQRPRHRRRRRRRSASAADSPTRRPCCGCATRWSRRSATGELPEERLADAAARVRALADWTRERPGGAETRGVAAGTARRPDRRRRPRRGPPRPARHRRRSAYDAARPSRRTSPRFTPVANIAVGDETPWGVAAELARLLPGTAHRRRTASDDGGTRPAPAGRKRARAAADRRIVAVVRDVHRHPWMADALDALLAARPDTVVVEMGVPQAPPARRPAHRDPRRRPRLRTGGRGGHRRQGADG